MGSASKDEYTGGIIRGILTHWKLLEEHCCSNTKYGTIYKSQQKQVFQSDLLVNFLQQIYQHHERDNEKHASRDKSKKEDNCISNVDGEFNV